MYVAGATLSKPEFQAILEDPGFVGKMFEATDHAVATGNEAGFAVYRNAGGLAMSEVVLAENSPGDLGPTNSINLDGLTTTDGTTVRPDVVTDLHVHPWSGWSSMRHSVTDLQTHCDHDRTQPGYISMVAVPRVHIDNVHVVFARMALGQEGKPDRRILNCMDDHAVVSDVNYATRRAGIATFTTRYSMQTRKIDDNPQIVADGVFRVAV
jgi:hypothetical protein